GGVLPCERAPSPFCPRPEVLPWPEPMPLPTRRLRWVEPGDGFKSFKSMNRLILELDHQMLKPLDHPFDRGAALELAHGADFAQAEALDRLAHAPSGADRTADELDANFIGHCTPRSSRTVQDRSRILNRARKMPAA